MFNFNWVDKYSEPHQIVSKHDTNVFVVSEMTLYNLVLIACSSRAWKDEETKKRGWGRQTCKMWKRVMKIEFTLHSAQFGQKHQPPLTASS